MEHSSSQWTTLNRIGGGVAMNEVLINALVARILAEEEKEGGMTINDVPLPYQEEVRRRVENAKKCSDK